VLVSELTIVVVVGIALALVFAAACAIRFAGRNAEERRLASKAAQDRVEKALGGAEASQSDLARFVP